MSNPIFFFFLHVSVQYCQYCLLKRWLIPHCIFSAPLSKINILHILGLMSVLYNMFHWPMCLCLCQNHTANYKTLHIVSNQEIWCFQLCYPFKIALDLNYTLEQMDPIDIYRIFHLEVKQSIFFCKHTWNIPQDRLCLVSKHVNEFKKPGSMPNIFCGHNGRKLEIKKNSGKFKNV